MVDAIGDGEFVGMWLNWHNISGLLSVMHQIDSARRGNISPVVALNR
jgi:hypothetical protein